MTKKLVPVLHDYDGDLQRRWYIYWHDADGTPRRTSGGKLNRFKTVEERRAFAQTVIADIIKEVGSVGPNAKDLVYQFISSQSQLWRKKSTQTFKSKADIFFQWLGPRTITNQVMVEFFNVELLQKRKVSGTTYNAYHMTLQMLFKEAGLPEYLKSVKKQRAFKTPSRYFQKNQAHQIIAELKAHEPMVYKAVCLIFYCFIRPGELRLLKVGHVVFKPTGIQICVPGEISKNKKTEYVNVPKAFEKELQDWVNSRNSEDYLLHQPGDPKTPLKAKFLADRHQQFIRKLGHDTTQYKLYSWKHTGNVMGYLAGCSVKDLQRQNRHHSLDQTDQYLRQLGVEDLAHMTDRFPMLGGA